MKRKEQKLEIQMYFLNTDDNIDISAHSPNKKPGFLIYELFKEKCTENNVVKRVLRAIKRRNDFYLHVY